MSNSDIKKLAKNHFESFKKLYNNICRTADLTMWEESTKILNDYWRNSLLSVNVKKEIVKLFENENLELKLVLNFMHSFAVPIPQKKWFMGDAHGTGIRRRHPCDIGTLYFDRFENGCVIPKWQFHAELAPEIYGANIKTAIDNESCNVWMSDKDKEGRLYCNFKTGLTFELAKTTDPDESATRQPYAYRKIKSWNGKEFELSNGKILHDTKEVVIFLDGEKITNQEVFQYDIRDNVGEQNVIILFESYFLASGIIREGKSGMLIECSEVPGTYETNCFVISPDWKHIVRRTRVPNMDIPGIKVNLNHSRWIKARNELSVFEKNFGAFFSHKRVDWIAQRHGEDFETRRLENLDIFCKDIRTFAAAIDAKYRDESLSVMENIISHTQMRPENTLYNKQMTCECTGSVCIFMWELNVAMKTEPIMFDYKALRREYFGVLMSTVTNMTEMFLRLFREREDCPLWEREKQNRKASENKTPEYYSSVSYYPIDIYERCNEPENLGVTMDTASRATLDRYFRGEEHISSVTELVLLRPDIMLFDPRPLLPPISLIKKFCELYPFLGTPDIRNISPEESLIKEFNKWTLEKGQMSNSKSKSKAGKSSKK